MPQNPSTGKTDRHILSEADHLKYRLKRAEADKDSHANARVKKGKGRARDLPDSGKQEAPSPSKDLSSSSHATTPTHSPVTSPQLTLPKRPAPTPPPAPLARTAAKKSSAGKSASKAPAAATIRDSAAASQLLRPMNQQAYSHSNTSPASDDGSNGARIAALEARLEEMQEEMNNWAHGFDCRLKALGV
jgi:hypothetical protein